MAEIDQLGFAAAVGGALARAGLSYAAACARHPDLDKAMLSRACNAHTLSAANFLVVCRALQLDPYAFVVSAKRRRVRMKDIAKQAVTHAAPRETSEKRP